MIEGCYEISRHFYFFIDGFETGEFMIIPSWTWLLIALLLYQTEKGFVVFDIFLFGRSIFFYFLLSLCFNVGSRTRSSPFGNVAISFNLCVK